MLRISTETSSNHAIRLRIEGLIADEAVAALDEACRPHLDGPARLVLDLSHVKFVDEAGLTYLNRLRGRGVELVTASPFISELLREFRP